MSIASVNNTETQFDYWEFVHCAICFLPFIPDPINAPTGPPTVPFWLTECGHTLCNNNINPDQSCGACGAAGVQLVPLQRDMLPPMCDWFRSVPHGLDALASAAKFQQETMASLVRFYKRKCIQQRATINKTKDVIAENKVLRNQIEELQRENAQLRGGQGGGLDRRFDQHQQRQQAFVRDRYEIGHHDRDRSYESNDFRNGNGKRTLSSLQNNFRSSSPRSISTPIPVGPSRLTLVQDHQQPVNPTITTTANVRQTPQSYTRPGTSTFEQYAYQAPIVPLRSAPLRHQQQHHRQGPPQQVHEQEQQGPQQHPEQPSQSQQQQMQTTGTRQKPSQSMLPPPPPLQNGIQHPQLSTPQYGRVPFRPSGQVVQQTQRMQPPPPPATTSHSSHASQTFTMPTSIPSSHRQEQTTADTRSAVMETPSKRFFTPRSAGISIGASGAHKVSSSSAGAARAPFVPRGE